MFIRWGKCWLRKRESIKPHHGPWSTRIKCLASVFYSRTSEMKHMQSLSKMWQQNWLAKELVQECGWMPQAEICPYESTWPTGQTRVNQKKIFCLKLHTLSCAAADLAILSVTTQPNWSMSKQLVLRRVAQHGEKFSLEHWVLSLASQCIALHCIAMHCNVWAGQDQVLNFLYLLE